MIVIDELDRCRPNYAIEFLETIKHFFDINGLIFVIGVDRDQLASSAKALFGQQLNFDEYYRKFAHRNVALLVKSQNMTEKFCRKLVKEYLSPEAFGKKNRFSYAEHDQYRIENIVELCLAFSLNARQMHELFRTLAHVVSRTKESNSYLLWGWHIGALFMITLSIKNRGLYEKIGKREISLSEFTESLNGSILFNDDNRNPFWWAVLLYLGVFGGNSTANFEQEFQKLGIWDSSNKEKEAFHKELDKFDDAFGRFRSQESVFSEIYKILEELKTFAK